MPQNKPFRDMFGQFSDPHKYNQDITLEMLARTFEWKSSAALNKAAELTLQRNHFHAGAYISQARMNAAKARAIREFSRKLNDIKVDAL